MKSIPLPWTAMVLEPIWGDFGGKRRQVGDVVKVPFAYTTNDGFDYLAFEIGNGHGLNKFGVDPLYRPLKYTKRTQE